MEERKRDSNLEVYRIITMLLIIAHHYVGNSGLLSDQAVYSAPLSFKSLFLLFFGAWGKMGINCFVLITGYFMCQSRITARKFIKLLGEVIFYRVVIYLIFTLSGYTQFSITSFMIMFIPVTKIEHNFTPCFLVFYLCIPFLNALVHHLTEKQHIRLICLSAFLYIILGTIHKVAMNYVSWFAVLFFIASYIRMYPKQCFSNGKLWALLTLGSITTATISVVIGAKLGVVGNLQMYYYFVSDSNALLAVMTGISSFMLFKNLKIPHSKFINTVAASTFGVLCIHAGGDTMRQWLWHDLLNNVGFYNSPYLLLHAFGSVLGIFIVCTFIDILRVRFVEMPFFNIFDRYWTKFEAWYAAIENKLYGKIGISDK
ncbi:MAG: acyltransferase [Clostridia bacterium]|nr:acyltransferase [Clostridia bacterium]